MTSHIGPGVDNTGGSSSCVWRQSWNTQASAPDPWPFETKITKNDMNILSYVFCLNVLLVWGWWIMFRMFCSGFRAKPTSCVRPNAAARTPPRYRFNSELMPVWLSEVRPAAVHDVVCSAVSHRHQILVTGAFSLSLCVCVCVCVCLVIASRSAHYSSGYALQRDWWCCKQSNSGSNSSGGDATRGNNDGSWDGRYWRAKDDVAHDQPKNRDRLVYSSSRKTLHDGRFALLVARHLLYYYVYFDISCLMLVDKINLHHHLLLLLLEKETRLVYFQFTGCHSSYCGGLLFTTFNLTLTITKSLPLQYQSTQLFLPNNRTNPSWII